MEGWTRDSPRRPPLLSGELAGLFSFWDLLSLRVIGKLIDRKVPREAIANGAEHLASRLGTHRPFAHEKLATVGTAFFAEIDDGWEDAGQKGQLAFQSVIRPLLNPITFNESSMAAIWRPHENVWINPAVQAGAPCVDGTRVPTSLLASLFNANEHTADDYFADDCDDYGLTPQQVGAALEYELTLAA